MKTLLRHLRLASGTIRHLGLAAGTILLLSVAAPPVRADLIALDDPRLGPATLVRDTNTQLDWLALSVTTGVLVDDILTELLPGGSLDSFRFATNQERKQLFADASLGDGTNIAARNSFVALFTGSPSPDKTVGAFTAPLPGPGTPMVFGTYITQVFQFGPDTLPRFYVDTQLVNLPLFGPAFLVREAVPEPSSVMLMLAGGIWLLLARQARGAQGTRRRRA